MAGLYVVDGKCTESMRKPPANNAKILPVKSDHNSPAFEQGTLGSEDDAFQAARVPMTLLGSECLAVSAWP